ncbi:MAG: aminopeptidase P family protein [Rhodobacteraceae bacterium]|nr:aminopeptidase P family protein [Paracoccaceae bacterium]
MGPRTFGRVRLPGIFAGGFLVFMQSLDNADVTLFLGPPGHPMLPMRLFAMLKECLDDRVAAISGLLVLADIPGDSGQKTIEATVRLLTDIGALRGSIGFIGDNRSAAFRSALTTVMPGANVSDQHSILDRMQRNRTPAKIAVFRTAAQLVSIATQAAYHVARPGVTDYERYAAVTMAQMARGGETGDGCQIGANEWGTHCGMPYGRPMPPGDLANLNISNVTYQGYTAKTARMIAFGQLTDRQELVLDACTRGVTAAWKVIRLGTLVRDLMNAAFDSYIEAGLIKDCEARTMPNNWSTGSDGGRAKTLAGMFPTPITKPRAAS